MEYLLPRASVLAVGTELTAGETLNRNAAWISEKLTRLGVEVVLHETVRDSRPEILAALEHCGRSSELLFVTGGLGPTTDDFTREVIAEWIGKPLQFHEPSWTGIQERLRQLAVPVAPSNRQQCFFPEGARVLPNSQGTANGFLLQKDGLLLW
ncbi:MAG: competence/damage-inducible protein A, partial [Oligoflexia bacterium]|nr:competence/damage-inducible protein A [Oligoflexia bacterium]